MESVTTALMVTSSMTYAAQLGTTATTATIQGLIIAIYYGMGKGTGIFIGGFLIKWFGSGNPDKTYGIRATFRVLGVASATAGIVYFLFNFFYARNRRIEAEKEEEMIDFTSLQQENKPELARL